MKNFKNTVAAMTLMVVMGLSATFANAGIMLTDLTVPNTPEPCTTKDEGPEGGIIMSDVVGGIIIYGLSGIIIYGRGTPNEPTCKG